MDRKPYFDRTFISVASQLGVPERAVILAEVVQSPNGVSSRQLKDILNEGRKGKKVPDSTVYNHISELEKAKLVAYSGRAARGIPRLVVATKLGEAAFNGALELDQTIQPIAAEAIIARIEDMAGELSEKGLEQLLGRIQALGQSPRNP